jgi:hypothetical protein
MSMRIGFGLCLARVHGCAASALLLACGGGGGSGAAAPAAKVDAAPVVIAAPVPAAPTPSPAQSAAPPGYVLVWSDEFESAGLPNAERWVHDTARNRVGWHNNELQYYAADRPENAVVRDGLLIITARRENLAGLADWGGQRYSSARTSAEATHEEAAAAESGGIYLAMEHWLEHSIASFELTEEGVVHLPHTPTSLQIGVAAISTIAALVALAGSFFGLYGNKPETADQPDPLQRTPIWWFAVLPLNTLYMGYLIPAFNRLASWLADTIDWRFWHDFVHNNIIRDFFVGFAGFASNILDANGIDGIVNGAGKVAQGLANIIRQSQTGYARNYALSVFLGAVALLAYFLLMAN